MPRPWIDRTFQPALTAPAEHLRLFPVWLLLGPRQVGKSSLLHFLIESDGRTWPVEVKLGSPRYDRLPPLERITEPNWQDGQVVSLAAAAEPVRMTDRWTLCAPAALDVGIDAGSVP